MGDKRAKRRETRRQEMLDAAMSIVIDHGLESLTIARIAKRLNAAVGALYRYFTGKEELIVALQRQALAEVEAEIKAKVKELDATLPAELSPEARSLARIIGAYYAYLEHSFHSPRRHRLVDLFMSAPSPLLSDASAQKVEESVIEILLTLRDLFKRAQDLEALDPGSLTERTYAGWAVIHAMDHFKKRDPMTPERVRVPKLMPAMYGALMRGWGADPDTVSEALGALGEIHFPAAG